MSDFNDDILLEKLVTFAGKAYPKFNNIVIMAGGAASGKGWIQSKLVGIQGKTYDVDELKKGAAKATGLKKKIKREFGTDISKLDMANPADVSHMHDIVSTMKLDKRVMDNMFMSAMMSDPRRKPNLIFDVTLKDMTKFVNLTRRLQEVGYEKENIHIVWVMNDWKTAVKQNKNPDRGRVVPEMILIDTHKGASVTMKQILSMGDKLRKFMDGDIWIVFNKMHVDSTFVKSADQPENSGYIKDAFYIKVKSAGKAAINPKDFNEKVYNKIKSYVPTIDTWT
jgi:hypothetical protein